MPQPIHDQTLPPEAPQRVLHNWNMRRFARDAFQRSIRRSTERLLTHPPDAKASR